MARPKTPQQKKEDSYAHDRVEGGEYPPADRKNRPRVKALVQRELRRISKQLLASQPEDVLQLAQRPRWTWRKSNVRLPEHLESTQRHRAGNRRNSAIWSDVIQKGKPSRICWAIDIGRWKAALLRALESQ
jgi:hypothetical protein